MPNQSGNEFPFFPLGVRNRPEFCGLSIPFHIGYVPVDWCVLTLIQRVSFSFSGWITKKLEGDICQTPV